VPTYVPCAATEGAADDDICVVAVVDDDGAATSTSPRAARVRASSSPRASRVALALESSSDSSPKSMITSALFFCSFVLAGAIVAIAAVSRRSRARA
jgi:hypothetical protein